MRLNLIVCTLVVFGMLSCDNNKTTEQVNLKLSIIEKYTNYIYPIDNTINEKDLRIDSSQSEVYRVWVLNEKPSKSFIFTFENKNDSITLSKKCFIWNNGIPVKVDSLIENVTKKISLKTWLLFKEKFSDSYFWNLSNNQNDGSFLCCNTYILEGKRHRNVEEKNYNLFLIPCGYGSLRKAFNDLFELTK
jgi:hypothetical protein